MRPYADNVLLRIEPPASETASGIALVHSRAPGAREHRTAVVLASGPGFKRPCCGVFVPNEVKPGDRVVVDALAGDKLKYDFDVSAPRQNQIPELSELAGERGQFRVVRHEEILAIIEDGVAVAAE